MGDISLADLIDPAAEARLRALAAGEAPPADDETKGADEWVEVHAGSLEVKGDDPTELEHKADPRGTQVLDADPETGIVEALVSVTGVEDRVKDIIEPGAYTKTMGERDPIGVWSHDDKTWVARTEEAVELMPGDPFFKGLKTMDGKPWPKEAGAVKVRARFNLETPHGAAAFSDVKFFEGKTGWSIGYRVTKALRNARTGVRLIKGLDWFEYSPVMVGAASQPMTLSVKSLEQPPEVDEHYGLADEDMLAELGDSEVKAYFDLRRSLGLGSHPLERKNRVRTAEGQRRFGQPIGSVIIPDGYGNRPISDAILDRLVRSAKADGDQEEVSQLEAARKLDPDDRRKALESGELASAEARKPEADPDAIPTDKAGQQRMLRKVAETDGVSGQARAHLLRLAEDPDYDPSSQEYVLGAAMGLRMAGSSIGGTKGEGVTDLADRLQHAHRTAGGTKPDPHARKPAVAAASSKPAASAAGGSSDRRQADRVAADAETRGRTAGTTMDRDKVLESLGGVDLSDGEFDRINAAIKTGDPAKVLEALGGVDLSDGEFDRINAAIKGKPAAGSSSKMPDYTGRGLDTPKKPASAQDRAGGGTAAENAAGVIDNMRRDGRDTDESAELQGLLDDFEKAPNAENAAALADRLKDVKESDDPERLAAVIEQFIAMFAAYGGGGQKKAAGEVVEVKRSSASLDRSPKANWVERAGELPAYIREVARAIHEDNGTPLDRAIPIAIGRIKRWAAGGGNVTAETRAKAAKAAAEWEALKAKSHMKYDSDLLAHIEHKTHAMIAAIDDAWGTLEAYGEVKFSTAVDEPVEDDPEVKSDDDLVDVSELVTRALEVKAALS